MTAVKMKLIAPNSLPIVGIRLIDGSTSEFEYSYDQKNRVSTYILPSGNTEMTLKKNGSTVLVDTSGIEWAALDVEFHSLLHS